MVQCSRHVFLRRVQTMMDEQKSMLKNIVDLTDDDLKRHFVISAICMNANGILDGVGNQRLREFLDKLPRHVVAVESLSLITGYIYSECISSRSIPDDIVGLIVCFF